MSALGDLMRDPNAFRGAADDLMRALRVGPQELGDLTMAITGQDPQHARAIVARHLSKPVTTIEPAPPRPKLEPGLGPQAHVQAPSASIAATSAPAAGHRAGCRAGLAGVKTSFWCRT
jgi:hypothetical protein